MIGDLVSFSTGLQSHRRRGHRSTFCGITGRPLHPDKGKIECKTCKKLYKGYLKTHKP